MFWVSNFDAQKHEATHLMHFVEHDVWMERHIWIIWRSALSQWGSRRACTVSSRAKDKPILGADPIFLIMMQGCAPINGTSRNRCLHTVKENGVMFCIRVNSAKSLSDAISHYSLFNCFSGRLCLWLLSRRDTVAVWTLGPVLSNYRLPPALRWRGRTAIV